MSSSFLTKGNKSVCVVKQKNKSCLVYRLEKREEYGFNFYGIFHRFELDTNKSLLNYPYGYQNTCIDLSGRGIKHIKKATTLKKPVYSLIGRYNYSGLQKILERYSPEKKDLPYATISTSTLATSNIGDDFYLNTLFLMTTKYGILTKISAIAGRDQEDCCSPEYYYEVYKVQLKTNPLKQIKEKDIIPEATAVECKVFSSPEVITPVKVKFNRSKSLDKLMDNLFLILRGEV